MRSTGELGVCIATSGPGATHLVTGLYDARADHMPVLAIAGQQARMALGGHYQQEVFRSTLPVDEQSCDGPEPLLTGIDRCYARRPLPKVIV